MSLQGAADEGIAFKQDIALFEQVANLFKVERLEIGADFENGVTLGGAQLLDLITRAEVIILAIDFTGTRRAAVVEDQLLQAFTQFRIETAECLVQRTFADAGGAAKDDKTSVGMRQAGMRCR
jgi:hypothetical protein